MVDTCSPRRAVSRTACGRICRLGVVSALAVLGPVVARDRLGPVGRCAIRARPSRSSIAFSSCCSPSRAPSRHFNTRSYGASYALTSLCRDAGAAADRHVGIWDGLAAITRLSRAGMRFGRPGRAAVQRPPVRASRGSRARSRRGGAPDTPAVDASGFGAGGGTGRAGARDRGAGGREDISYADLGVEQLGAVYERVLDLDPRELPDDDARAFRRTLEGRAHSRRRKESGTFYTPQPLAEFVVRRTLAPARAWARRTDDILALRVVDPAMGSGAFLVAACRFLADAYERALVDEGRCAETDLDRRCACRDSPTHRQQVPGGRGRQSRRRAARASVALAHDAREGQAAQLLRSSASVRRLADWRVAGRPLAPVADRIATVQASTPLFEAAGLEAAIRSIAHPWRQLRNGRDDTRRRRARARAAAGPRSRASDRRSAPWRAACDLWCARWFWNRDRPQPSPPEMRAAIDALLRDDRSLRHARACGVERLDGSHGARTIAGRHRFFHWPIEFADLFYDDDGAPRPRAGFHAVIGNPPWEMLRGGDPDRRNLVSFVRESGLYPVVRPRTRQSVPAVSRAIACHSTRPGGRVGLVLPWGLAADEGAASLQAPPVASRSRGHDRRSRQRGRALSHPPRPAIHGRRRCIAGRRTAAHSCKVRRAHRRARSTSLPGTDDPEWPHDFPTRLDAETVKIAGGAALRIPDARTPGDLDWLVAQCRRFPPLGDSPGWHVRFGRELNATEDASVVRSAGPSGHRRQTHRAVPREPPAGRTAGFREAAPTDCSRPALSVASARVPGRRRCRQPADAHRGHRAGRRRDHAHALLSSNGAASTTSSDFLCALFNSSPLNRIVRMLMGGHVTTGLVEHLPVPRWTGDRDQRAARGTCAASSLGRLPGAR